MRCSDFHDRVNQLLDERQELARDSAVQRHADSCEECQRDLQGYQLLMSRTGASSVRPTQPTNNRTPIVWFTVAAALLLMFTFFRGTEPQTHTAKANPEVTTLTVVEEPMLVQAETTSTDGVAGNDHVVVSGHFVQPILSLGFVAQADWSQVQPVEMPFGVRVPTVETEWIQVVADEMVPLKESVNSTYNLIVRTLSTSA